MLINFSCKETEKIYNDVVSTKLPKDIQRIARRKLRMLNSAKSTNDLRIQKGNNLKGLSGKLQGHYSIRVNNQWRICFTWYKGDCYNVRIVDYH